MSRLPLSRRLLLPISRLGPPERDGLPPELYRVTVNENLPEPSADQLLRARELLSVRLGGETLAATITQLEEFGFRCEKITKDHWQGYSQLQMMAKNQPRKNSKNFYLLRQGDTLEHFLSEMFDLEKLYR